ncbi:MAG TPA: hypothetical protein VGL42_14245 [Opitutaceae bacterium]
MSYRYTDRLAVAVAREIEIAVGDRLQLKFNGTSVEGTRLNNGELVTVREVAPDGALVVEAGAGGRKTLAPAQRVLVRGYAVSMVTFCPWRTKEWTMPWSRLDSYSFSNEQELERLERKRQFGHSVAGGGESVRLGGRCESSASSQVFSPGKLCGVKSA